MLLTRNDVLLTRNEELTNEIKAHAEQIDKLHKQMAELLTRTEKLTNENKAQAEQIDELHKQMAELRTRNEELTNENKAQAEQIDKLHKQMAELRAGYHLQDVAPVLAKDGTDITQLVALICDGNAKQKLFAAESLQRLAANNDNQVLIAKAGGIPPLVVLIRDGNDEQKEFAALALRYLADNLANNQILIPEAGGIPPLVALERGYITHQIRWGTTAGEHYRGQNPATSALRKLAANADNKVLIAKAKREAGI